MFFKWKCMNSKFHRRQLDENFYPTGTLTTWNGYEYEYVDDAKTLSEAEQYCVERGGHLTSITSQAENNFLISGFG